MRVREFAGKGLILPTIFVTKRRVCGENRKNSRFDGKNRGFGTAVTEQAGSSRGRAASRAGGVLAAHSPFDRLLCGQCGALAEVM